MVDRISTGDRRGELYFQCRHKSSCEKFCGVGRNALSKSGLFRSSSSSSSFLTYTTGGLIAAYLAACTVLSAAP